MIKKSISLLLIISIILTLFAACSKQTSPLDNGQQETNYKEEAENIKPENEEKQDNAYAQKVVGNIKNFEEFKDSQRGRYDFRAKDLSNLTMASLQDYGSFILDTQTLVPDSFSETYEVLKSFGRDPGLDVRSLHNDGITGKGVSVAIIDGVLLKEHNEYKDRIVFYEDLVDNENAHYHAPMVTSILCGKDAGVAPEAKLYYVSYINDELQTIEKSEERYASLAKSIERIVEINKELPKDEKIRVLSISSGWDPSATAIEKAIDKAKKDGIFVVTARLYDHDGLYFGGLKREVLSDPNDINSYSALYVDEYEEAGEILFAPMDARWVASHVGIDDYVMYSRGAWSMVVPYISGVYTLACQVYPDITPELFWEIALATGNDLKDKDNQFNSKTIKIINPTKLIEEIKKLY